MERRVGTIRVLLVDDHPAIHDAIASLMSGKMGLDVVGRACSARETLDMARKLEPDVVVTDMSLGDAHGLDLIHNLKAELPDLRIVVYSMYNETVYAERVLRAGASAYLMKTESPNAVIEAVRTVHQGEVYLSHRMSSKILTKVARGHSSGPQFPVDSLTDREMAVFQMLGQGLGIKAIMEKLCLSRKTVEAYRRKAKEKLELESTDELLQYAIEWTHDQGHSRG